MVLRCCPWGLVDFWLLFQGAMFLLWPAGVWLRLLCQKLCALQEISCLCVDRVCEIWGAERGRKDAPHPPITMSFLLQVVLRRLYKVGWAENMNVERCCGCVRCYVSCGWEGGILMANVNNCGTVWGRFWSNTSHKDHVQLCTSKIEFLEGHWGQGRLWIVNCSVNREN